MNIKKNIFLLIKILIIVASIGYIIIKIYSEKQNGVLYNELTDFTSLDKLYLFLVIVLMPFNWLLESIKFKYLVSNLESLTLSQSIKATITGITVSIFTPKRIGDFGGRILFLKKENRVSGVFATLLGSLSQLLVTLIVGSLLFPLYLTYDNKFQPLNINLHLVFTFVSIVIVLLFFIYMNINRVGEVLSKLSILKKHAKFILFLRTYDKKQLLSFFLISFTRYIIFSFQFTLLLWAFGLDIPYLTAVIGISQVYFLMVLIPTFALGELGVRGSLAVWIFSIFTTTSSGVITASVVLWFVNLALPAIIGTVFLSKVKV